MIFFHFLFIYSSLYSFIGKMLSMRIFCGFCIIFLFIHSFYSNIVLQLKWYLRKQVHTHRAYTLDRACLDENIQMIKQAPFFFFVCPWTLPYNLRTWNEVRYQRPNIRNLLTTMLYAHHALDFYQFQSIF